MNTKSKIRIIKKSDIRPPVVKPSAAKATRVAAREVVSNVTDWVTDFKARKREETKAAFEQLFSSQARQTES